MIICYAQGMALLYKASTELKMNIPLPEVVRIWRGGCIIRSSMLEIFYKAFTENPKLPNLLLDKTVAGILQSKKHNMVTVIMHATQTGYPVAALMTSLCYLEAYRSEFLPTNLIQAQRDYFGAHTYQTGGYAGFFIPNGDRLTIKNTCMENHKRPSATVLFIFGGSGDLNFRKLSPALYNLFIDNWMPEKFSIVGIGRTEYSDVDYRGRLLDGIKQFSRRKDSCRGAMAGIFHSMFLSENGCGER